MIFYYMVASVSDPDPGYFQAMDPDPDPRVVKKELKFGINI